MGYRLINLVGLQGLSCFSLTIFLKKSNISLINTICLVEESSQNVHSWEIRNRGRNLGNIYSFFYFLAILRIS